MAGRTSTAQPKTIKVRSAAKATARVKAAKPAAVAAETAVKTAVAKPRRRVKAETRTRVYWAVFNPDLRRVAVFEFDQRDEADKRARSFRNRQVASTSCRRSRPSCKRRASAPETQPCGILPSCTFSLC